MVIAALLFATLLAQAQPDAKELLRKVADVYSNMREGDVTATAPVTLPDQPESKLSTRTAWRMPDKRRTEITGTSLGDFIYIDDGKTARRYRVASKEYIETPIPNPSVSDWPMGRFSKSGKQVTSAKLLRQEKLSTEIGRFDCYVVEFEDSRGGLTRWWIDKRFLVLREETFRHEKPRVRISREELVYQSVNQPLPDSTFVFTPPPEAKRVEKFSQ